MIKRLISLTAVIMFVSMLSIRGTALASDVEWPATMNPIAGITIIGIDSDTLYDIGQNGRGTEMYQGDFPVQRLWYARLITTLREAHAILVAIDYVLMYYPPARPVDYTLANVISRGPPPVINVFDIMPRTPLQSPDIDLRKFAIRGTSPGQVDAVRAQALALPYPELADVSATLASTHELVDPDGLTRRCPLFLEYGDIVLPSLALSIFMQTAGISPGDVRVSGGYMTIRGMKVPLSAEGSLSVAFPPQREVFQRRSFRDVVKIKDDFKKGSREKHEKKMIDWFENQIVIVGLTDSTLKDITTTPAGGLYPNCEVAAAAANHLLNLWARARGVRKPVWTAPDYQSPGTQEQTTGKAEETTNTEETKDVEAGEIKIEKR